MLDPEIVADLLEAVSNDKVAHARGKEIRTLRGVRGVAMGELARIGAAVWAEDAPSLDDEDAINTLFNTAWEDGLVAIGILAALLPDDPAAALDLGRDWLERVDDHQTADALGWLVLGPGVLASGGSLAEALDGALTHRRPEVRRAAVSAGLALLPEEITGPSAAPLRARVGAEAVRFVDEPLSDEVRALLDLAVRDGDPAVRKAVRRLAAAWAMHEPDLASEWVVEVRGGAPKMIREAVDKAARKARRLARRADG
jgi:hypothetical protein